MNKEDMRIRIRKCVRELRRRKVLRGCKEGNGVILTKSATL